MGNECGQPQPPRASDRDKNGSRIQNTLLFVSRLGRFVRHSIKEWNKKWPDIVMKWSNRENGGRGWCRGVQLAGDAIRCRKVFSPATPGLGVWRCLCKDVCVAGRILLLMLRWPTSSCWYVSWSSARRE